MVKYQYVEMLDNWKVKNITRTRQNSRMTGLPQGNGMQHQATTGNTISRQQATTGNTISRQQALLTTANRFNSE